VGTPAFVLMAGLVTIAGTTSMSVHRSRAKMVLNARTVPTSLFAHAQTALLV
jgi:hypothetical protein